MTHEEIMFIMPVSELFNPIQYGGHYGSLKFLPKYLIFTCISDILFLDFICYHGNHFVDSTFD